MPDLNTVPFSDCTAQTALICVRANNQSLTMLGCGFGTESVRLGLKVDDYAPWLIKRAATMFFFVYTRLTFVAQGYKPVCLWEVRTKVWSDRSDLDAAGNTKQAKDAQSNNVIAIRDHRGPPQADSG
jgi:hypothetical protein